MSFREADAIQLFPAYGRVTNGKPILNQQICKWLVETTKCAYAMNDLEAPQGITGYQTKKQPVSIAEMAGIDPQLICQAAT